MVIARLGVVKLPQQFNQHRNVFMWIETKDRRLNL